MFSDRLKRQAAALDAIEYSRHKSRISGRYYDSRDYYDNRERRYYDRFDDRYRYDDDRRYRNYDDDRYRYDRYDDYRYRNGDSRVRTYPCGK